MINIKKLITGILLAAAVSLPSFAGTIDFENMPNDYLFNGGQKNFGTYWAGITFGPASTILDSARYGGYNYVGYPPHSGTSVLFSIDTPYINAIFDGSVDEVSFWYSAGQPFSVLAYDAADTLITSQVLANNYETNSFVDIKSGSANIKKVVFSGTGNYFTIDDFSAPNFDAVSGKPRGDGVPDSASTFVLSALGLLAVVAGRRSKFAK